MQIEKKATCRRVRAWLQDVHDGEAPAGQARFARAAEAHLERCPRCRSFREFLCGYGQELGAALDGLVRQSTTASPRAPARRAPARRRIAWAVPAAAVALWPSRPVSRRRAWPLERAWSARSAPRWPPWWRNFTPGPWRRGSKTPWPSEPCGKGWTKGTACRAWAKGKARLNDDQRSLAELFPGHENIVPGQVQQQEKVRIEQLFDRP
jgi:hypothetical protein